jgi:hypothetical protein
MKSRILHALFALTVGAGVCLAQDRIETKTIDGVKHILNPEKPSKGTVVLEVEKSLEINPFEQPDVAMRYMLFARERCPIRPRPPINEQGLPGRPIPPALGGARRQRSA